MFKHLSFILLAGLTVSACQRRPVPPPPTEIGGMALARFGDQIITERELADRIARIEKEFPRKYATHPQKLALLQELINLEILYREALRKGLDERFEFKTRLVDLYLRDLSQAAEASITEQTISDFYQRQKDSLDQVSARHILLKTEGKSSAEKSELRKKMEELRAQALKDPSTFEELARKNSQDGSAQNGGNLGFFIRSQMVKPFSDAAFQLQKPLEISPVVETEFGFHIIQLVESRRSLDFFREKIRAELVRQGNASRLEAELDRLKQDLKIEIYEDNLLKMSPLPEAMEKE